VVVLMVVLVLVLGYKMPHTRRALLLPPSSWALFHLPYL
jgi:hypothetical protein